MTRDEKDDAEVGGDDQSSPDTVGQMRDRFQRYASHGDVSVTKHAKGENTWETEGDGLKIKDAALRALGNPNLLTSYRVIAVLTLMHMEGLAPGFQRVYIHELSARAGCSEDTVGRCLKLLAENRVLDRHISRSFNSELGRPDSMHLLRKRQPLLQALRDVSVLSDGRNRRGRHRKSIRQPDSLGSRTVRSNLDK